MQLNYVTDFVAACEQMGIEYDFVSTHMYPNDGMCPPNDAANRQGQAFNADCFPGLVKAARASLPANKPLYLTEYSVGCCGENPESNSAALIFRAVSSLHDTVEVLSYWTFSMIFEEESEPTAELQGTFGLLSEHGVPKPGWAAFQLLHSHAGDTLLPTVSDPPWVGSGAVNTSGCTMAPIGCFADEAPQPACCVSNPGPNCQGCGAHACKLNSFAHFDNAPELNSPETCGRHCASAGWDVFGLQQGDCRCGMASNWQQHGQGCVANTAANCTEPCPGASSAVCGSQWNLRMFNLDCPDRQKAPNVVAFATTNSSAAQPSVSVFLSYWSEGSNPGPQKVEIQVKLGSGGAIGGVGVPASGQATLYRVDAEHANAAKVWQNSMSSVATPDAAQLAQLQAAAKPTAESVAVSISGRAASLTIDSVPPNSAYVVTLR